MGKTFLFYRFISENLTAYLNKEETFRYIESAFRDGYVQETGTAITRVLPPVSRFTPSGERSQKRETVLSKIKEFFQRFFDISG
jgi:type I restriction enzyme R subunit